MVDETAYTHMSLPDYDEVADIEVLNNNFKMIDEMIAQLADLESVSYDTSSQRLHLLSSLAYVDDDVNVPNNLFELGSSYYGNLRDIAEFWDTQSYVVRDLCDDLGSHTSDLASLADNSTELLNLCNNMEASDYTIRFFPQYDASASIQIDEDYVSIFNWATADRINNTITITAYSTPEYVKLDPTNIEISDSSSSTTLDTTTIKIADDEHTVTMSTGYSEYHDNGYVQVASTGYGDSSITMTDVDVYTGYGSWGRVDRVGASDSLNGTIDGIFRRINALDHLDD